MERFWEKSFFHQWEHEGCNVAGSSIMILTKHIVWATKEGLHRKHFKVLEWSSQSLDPNPIENLWSELNVCVSQWQPQNVPALEKIFMEEWTKIATTVQILLKAYRKHLTSDINDQGYITRYWGERFSKMRCIRELEHYRLVFKWGDFQNL